MPELPDLHVIVHFLHERLVGEQLDTVDIVRPIIARDLTQKGWTEQLVGQYVQEVLRRGKFLLVSWSKPVWLVVNPMRSGRLRYWPMRHNDKTRPCIRLDFSRGAVLEYSDPDMMGKVYLTASPVDVPGFSELGPDALDPGLTAAAFAERLPHYRGEVKGVLVNQRFVAGIGNAYADEILFAAGIYPYRKVCSLTPVEVDRLHASVQAVLFKAITVLTERVEADIHVELRDFMQVHGRGAQACPRCGSPISQVTARGRLTNYCRNCQPGLLVQQ